MIEQTKSEQIHNRKLYLNNIIIASLMANKSGNAIRVSHQGRYQGKNRSARFLYGLKSVSFGST